MYILLGRSTDSPEDVTPICQIHLNQLEMANNTENDWMPFRKFIPPKTQNSPDRLGNIFVKSFTPIM